MTIPVDFPFHTLSRGRHAGPDAGACLLEAASWLAGEPWSDHPQCVSPVLGAFGRGVNDAMPDDATRALLIPLLPRLLNTAGDGRDVRRAGIAADAAARYDAAARHAADAAYAAAAAAAAAARYAAAAAAADFWPQVVADFEAMIVAADPV